MPPLYKTKFKNYIVFYCVSAMKQLFAACGRETGKYFFAHPKPYQEWIFNSGDTDVACAAVLMKGLKLYRHNRCESFKHSVLLHRVFIHVHGPINKTRGISMQDRPNTLHSLWAQRETNVTRVHSVSETNWTQAQARFLSQFTHSLWFLTWTLLFSSHLFQ